MTLIRWSFLLLSVVAVGCNRTVSKAPGRTLTVFAASSLTDAFTEIGRQFEAAPPGVDVVFNFAGSQQLAQQLSQGAPGDVFASANQKQMEVVVENGRVAPDTPKIFAQNRLVLIYPRGNPGNVRQLHDLANRELNVILADAAVPVGQYSLDFLEKAGQEVTFGADFKNRVLAGVDSYEQNVRTVFTKVALGEADAGIVYSSDIVGTGSDNVRQLDIPDALNTSARYPIAPIDDSDRPDLAQRFIDFVLSPDGQNILANYGFIPAP